MEREAIKRVLQGDPHDYEALVAAVEAVEAEFDWLPPEGPARDLMVGIRIHQYAEDVAADDRDRWDARASYLMSHAVAVVRDLDETRQQLAEAREQLHKIGRKAFWAGRSDTQK